MNIRKLSIAALFLVPAVIFVLNVTPERAVALANTYAMAFSTVHMPASTDEAEQLDLAIEAFRRGMVDAKPDIILAYSSPKLSFWHSNGIMRTREEFAEVVRSGAEIFKRVELTQRRLTIIGDTAVERHHFSADVLIGNDLKHFELKVLEIWKKSDRWRLIARQAFKL